MTPAQLATLKTEIQADPLSIGYAALVTLGSDSGVADLLGDSAKATAGPKVAVTLVPSYQVANAIDPTEFAALTAIQLQRLAVVLAPGQVDASNANIRTALAAIFPAGGATRTSLLALQSRAGTRAEQLFGPGASVGNLDVAKALRG